MKLSFKKSKIIFYKSILVFLLSFISLLFQSVNAQEFSFIKKIEINNLWDFTTDKLGNLYTADNKVLSKYDQDGNFICTYSNNDYLNYRFIDATDPFKLMLFSSEFRAIKLLDAHFGLAGDISLDNIPDIGYPYLACRTDDGNFWIYDQQNLQLKKLNTNGSVIFSTGNLYILGERNYMPIFMCYTGEWIIMNNSRSEVLVFDRFGSYYKGFAIDSAMFVQAIEKQILFLKNDKLISMDFTLMKQTEVLAPDLTNVYAIRMEQHRFYLLRKNAIEIYSF